MWMVLRTLFDTLQILTDCLTDRVLFTLKDRKCFQNISTFFSFAIWRVF